MPLPVSLLAVKLTVSDAVMSADSDSDFDSFDNERVGMLRVLVSCDSVGVGMDKDKDFVAEAEISSEKLIVVEGLFMLWEADSVGSSLNDMDSVGLLNE